MKLRSKGLTVIEILVIVQIVVVTIAVLSPVFIRSRQSAYSANCQANLERIGNAVKMYLSDWEDTYPTNRPIIGATVGTLTHVASLSPVGTNPVTGQPYRFVSSINWVEGLYDFIEPTTKKSNTSTVWRCQSASNSDMTPTGGVNPAVTYTFNFSLLEKRSRVVRNPALQLLCREYGRLTVALCKGYGVVSGGDVDPSFPATLGGTPPVPQDPFLALNDRDLQLPPYSMPVCAPGNNASACKLHGNGSHILFADGHVKQFNATLMPDMPDGSLSVSAGTAAATKQSWDTVDNRWYNFAKVPTNASERARYKTIAITP